MNTKCLTASMRIYFLHMLDEYCYEKYTSYSDDFDLWPKLLYQYFNELTLGKAIESAYLTRKSE